MGSIYLTTIKVSHLQVVRVHTLLLAPSIVASSVQGRVPFRLGSQNSHPTLCCLQLAFNSWVSVTVCLFTKVVVDSILPFLPLTKARRLSYRDNLQTMSSCCTCPCSLLRLPVFHIYRYLICCEKLWDWASRTSGWLCIVSYVYYYTSTEIGKSPLRIFLFSFEWWFVECIVSCPVLFMGSSMHNEENRRW